MKSGESDDETLLVAAQVKEDEEKIVEANVAAACCVFVFCIALDALTSLPTDASVDIPASARFSSLSLVVLIAAPPIDSTWLFEQRGIGVMLLMVVSFLGFHHGALHARLADALYSIVGGLATVVFFAFSGVKPGEKHFDGKGKRENLVALAAALLLYVGLRVLKASLSHATEVVQFTERSEDDVDALHNGFETRGMAAADDVSAVFSAFGGTLVVANGAILLLKHDQIYDQGSTMVSAETIQLSIFVFTSAFVCLLSGFKTMDSLPALFGDAACSGSRDVCAAAFRARRFHMSNSVGPALVLVAAAVGQTLLAFPKERRCQNRRDFYQPDELRIVKNAVTGAGISSIIAVLGAVIASWIFADSTSLFASVETSLLFASIPFAWFGDSTLACLLHVGGQLVYTAAKLGSPFGYDLRYFTHHCLASTVFLLIVLAITTAISRLLYLSCCSKDNYIDWVETCTAVCLVFVTSIQLLLTLLTLGAVSGFDGAMEAEYRTWSVYALEFSTQHTLSFFFCAALVGGRYEHHQAYVSSKLLKVSWFALPLMLFVGWGVTVLTSGSGDPYSGVSEVAVIVTSSVSAVVPWVVIGALVC